MCAGTNHLIGIRTIFLKTISSRTISHGQYHLQIQLSNYLTAFGISPKTGTTSSHQTYLSPILEPQILLIKRNVDCPADSVQVQGNIVQGDSVQRDTIQGDIVQGRYCPGGYCPGECCPGDNVLIPLSQTRPHNAENGYRNQSPHIVAISA